MAAQKHIMSCIFVYLCTYVIIIGTLNLLSQEDLSGSLACKTYNGSKMDCSHRNLVDIPILDKNRTTMLDLSHNQLQEIHGSPFENLPNLAILDLSNNMISKLNSAVFKGLNSLLKLDLEDNELLSLSSDVFGELHELVYLNIQSNFRLDISSQIFTTLESLQYLYMDCIGNEPTTVMSDLYSLTRLKVLNIRLILRVNVTSAILQPLDGLPIQDFTLSWLPQCKYCYLNITTFETLTNVRKLYIDFTLLPALESLSSPLDTLILKSFSMGYPIVIGNTTFEVLAKVKESLVLLFLFFPIHHIENDAFTWTPNLIGIGVYGQLQTLDKQAFRGLTGLQGLYLSGNHLTAVPSEALAVIGKFQSLQLLDLSSNRITSIPDGAFLGVSSLHTLSLENNRFDDLIINTRWLNVLQNLQHINFGSSGGAIFNSVDIDLPVPLPSIKTLELNSIRAVKFKTNICSLFPNVATIVISKADLSGAIFPSALHECLLLKEFDLSGSSSNINSLDPKHTNISIPSLEDLILAQNKLKSIEQIYFIKAPNLTSLNLNDNEIEHIDSGIVHAYKYLIHLSIDGNALVSLSGLEHLTLLKHLNAARNQITQVPQWLISTKNEPVLITLDLSDNPFSCTCKIEKFRNWIESDTNTWLQPGQYNCASPESQKGISISEVKLDCRSYTAFYIGISIPFLILSCVLIIFLIRYRWHIKYKLFLLYRNYRPFPEINDDFEMLQLQYHAYIAYNENSEDDAWVMNDLQPNMEQGPEPVHLCIKRRDFIPGHSLIESISENIQQSRKTILVLSPNFVGSEWCYHEMEMAKMRLLDENLDVIVMVLLKEIPNNMITLSLRLLLCKKEYLKWPKDRAGQRLFWQRLRQELKTPIQIDRRFCM